MELTKIRPKNFIAFLMLFFLSFQYAYAQTWGEFFNQKKTQKKYLLEQIAALQMYIGYAKKGYDIAGSGLNTIRDITRGEFNLHDTFISSLKTVNPLLRNSSKVADIIALQISISKAFANLNKNSLLQLSDQLYISGVKERVMDECQEDLEELLLVITSGRIEMDDEQRIKRLDRIYAAMNEKSVFAQHFSGEVNLLIYQKKDEINSIELLKKLYEKDN